MAKRIEKIKKLYEEWKHQRDTIELGVYSSVAVLCEDCGYRFVARVRMTLPPCLKCGSVNTYDYKKVD
ncbi:MAG: hypothetical protein RMJ67_07715 [Elusimicrobiota bacterium]|nr:hypothetical protein [Endomicrobiia bacterium]MDW8166379.1 hypothetical protein [Elusimicrobiota bacterium]